MGTRLFVVRGGTGFVRGSCQGSNHLSIRRTGNTAFVKRCSLRFCLGGFEEELVQTWDLVFLEDFFQEFFVFHIRYCNLRYALVLGVPKNTIFGDGTKGTSEFLHSLCFLLPTSDQFSSGYDLPCPSMKVSRADIQSFLVGVVSKIGSVPPGFHSESSVSFSTESGKKKEEFVAL